MSRARYRAYAASYKAAFRSRYGANRDVYKVAFRTRYEANEAACKAASKATYRAKREQVRSAYLLDSARNRAACMVRMGTKVRAQRRGRYALREPNDDAKLQYVMELKCKLIANSKVRASLKRAFAATHADVALNMSQTGLTIAACRPASQSVLTKALKERKHSAGKLLGAIANINELSITCDVLGDQGHGTSSEPYFYETAYAPVKRQSAIAVDDCGRCVVAEEVLDKDGNPFERPLWKCTEECKHPTEDEVACICRVKAMFKQPVQQVREGFKDLDIRCPYLHRTLPPTVYSSDSDDDEEREHVPPVHDGDADDGDHWMDHPFPCSSMGSCGSQL